MLRQDSSATTAAESSPTRSGTPFQSDLFDEIEKAHPHILDKFLRYWTTAA